MPHHNPIITYLQHRGVPYEVIEHAPTNSLQQAAKLAEVAPEQVARALLLRGEERAVLAVLPLNHVINFSALSALAGSKFEPVELSTVRYLCRECELGTLPPLAPILGVSALLDEALFNNRYIYIEPGSHNLLLRLSGSDFRRLQQGARTGSFSSPMATLHATDQELTKRGEFARHHHVSQLRPDEEMKERIKELKNLPPLTNLSAKLLQMRNNPDATVSELARLIETDPSLSAQILHHVHAPYYGYPGEMKNVEQAINQVLGLDTALNNALGLTTLRPFDIPRDGPLGLNSLWSHAVHTATLCQALCSLLPRHLEVNPAMAYLAGLLHNFGFLVLGHLLRPEYFLLNRVAEANPEVPLTLLEKRTLGISHTRVGALAMHAWQMPPVLEITAREHHNEFYQGEHWLYPNLVMLANCLLKSHGIGDAAEATPPPSLLNALGIPLEEARHSADYQLAGATDLDAITAGLAA